MNVRSADRRGSILIVTLWIVSLLSLFAFGLTSMARLSVRQERWSQDETFSQQQLLSLAELAVARLQQDADLDVDTLQEDWAKPYKLSSESLLASFEQTGRKQRTFGLSIVAIDEAGKINVNLASKELLIEVLRETGWEINAKAVAAAILDWRDPDNDGFAERGHYDSGDRAYAPANMDLRHIEELLFVEGVTPAIFFGEDRNHNGRLDPQEDDGDVFEPPDNADGRLQPGLYDLLTTYGNGTININGSPEWVLRSALRVVRTPSEAQQLARSIVRTRRGADGLDGTEDDRPFHTEDEIVKVLGEAYGQLLGAGVEFGTASEAFRFLLRVELPDTHHVLEGDLLVVREDGAISVSEWHVS